MTSAILKRLNVSDSNLVIRLGAGRHEKSCKMSANHNSGIQMSTHILAEKSAI